MGMEQIDMAAPAADRAGLFAEARACVDHPDFDAAMSAFCRDLANFHSLEFFRRTGVVDTITWGAALLILYLDAYAPEQANASRIVAICEGGGLSGASAARNAIAVLRQAGMIAVDDDSGAGRAHRLRPTPALIGMMQRELSIRLAAMESVVAWPKPASEWAVSEGVLMAFVRKNVEAYTQDRFQLYGDFPEIRGFMDRHCGYLILMDSLPRLEVSSDGASGVLPLSEISRKFAVSRAHVRKLFAAAADQDWLCFESGGRLTLAPPEFDRFRLWFGHEFAWTRRLVGTL